MSTPDKPTEFDALVKIREGEPYFALLGRDRLSVPLILEWAQMNREHAMANYAGEKLEHELRQSTEAEELAWQMEDYREGVNMIRERGEEKPKPAYTGTVLDPETAARSHAHNTKVRAVTALQNSIAELTTVATALEDVDGVASASIRAQIRAMREIADTLEPRPVMQS